MKCASSRRRPGLDCAGAASLEFALVGLAFLLILFGTLDLGRYFMTMHSLRTLTSALARATLVYCGRTGAVYTSSCNLPAAGVDSAESQVPFLKSIDFTSTPSATRSQAVAGVATITASATYNFTFVLPIFARLSGPISASTTLRTYN